MESKNLLHQWVALSTLSSLKTFEKVDEKRRYSLVATNYTVMRSNKNGLCQQVRGFRCGPQRLLALVHDQDKKKTAKHRRRRRPSIWCTSPVRRSPTTGGTAEHDNVATDREQEEGREPQEKGAKKKEDWRWDAQGEWRQRTVPRKEEDGGECGREKAEEKQIEERRKRYEKSKPRPEEFMFNDHE